MKAIISLYFFIISISYAEVFIVEMKHKLSEVELSTIRSLKHVTQVTPFLPYDDDEYLNRLYEIEASTDIAHELKQFKFIKLIEKDHMVELYEVRPNPQSEMFVDDMLYPLQWALHNQGQIVSSQRVNGGVDEVKGVKGFDINWKGHIDQIESLLRKDPVVAVIDMGIDLQHPELKDSIFINESECDIDEHSGEFVLQRLVNSRREDRDRNGFPGDCMGWNFATNSILFEASPNDDTGHGTHVSGIIAAKRNNAMGISGVSDRIKILPLRVTGRVDETDEREQLRYRSASRRIAKAIYYAARNRVDVINLSLGWPSSMDTQFMRNAFREAERFNVLVVAAAGNNNSKANIYPCSYRSVVCVGSVDIDGAKSAFSNYGGEVDILAPGNQIASTIPTSFIPLKLNLQGYDLLSGTSQAAPYVSAIAALLKSILFHQSPNGMLRSVPNREIKRRLYFSAKEKVDVKASKFGLVQLNESLKLEMAAGVIPVLKELNEITYNAETKQINDLAFDFENLGLNASNIIVKIKSHNKSVKITNENQLIAELAMGQTTKISLDAYIENENAHSTILFEIKVIIGDETKTFFHEVYLSRNLEFENDIYPISIDNDQSLIIFRNQFKDSTVWTEADLSPELRSLWQRLNFTDRRTRINLRTVDSLFDTSMPDYYAINTHDKDIEVIVLKNNEETYQVLDKLLFKNTHQVLDVTRMDLNYDGQSDYLIKTIEIVDNQTFKIVYHYFNNNLKPLYKDISRIEKYEDRHSIKVNSSTQRFLKSKLPSGELIATPIFITRAQVPKEDQIIDPWTSLDRTQRRRVYHLEVIKENNEYVFKPRTLMNKNFTDKVREQFAYLIPSAISSNDSGYEVIALRHQSKKDFYNGVVKAVLSYGLGFARFNLQLKYDSDDYSLELLDKLNSQLVGNAQHEHINLDNKSIERYDAFIGFETNSVVNISVSKENSEKRFIYRMQESKDRIQSFIASYSLDELTFLFFETIDDILLVQLLEGKQIESRLDTTKFSFLPGTVMSDLFFPIVTNFEGRLNPGVYIDSTSIVGQRVYTMTPHGENFIAPIKYSVKLPQVCGIQDQNCGLAGNLDTKYCLPLNPYRGAKGYHSYMFLCKIKDDYYLKKVAL